MFVVLGLISSPTDNDFSYQESPYTAKEYVSQEIDKELDDLQTADAEDFTDKMFDLIVKYKNFASSATRVTENYQPNSQVMELMKTNKNILEQAKAKLNLLF